MVIKAIVDKIENGKAILLSDEAGVEISIPTCMLEGIYSEGETLSLTIDEANEILHKTDSK